MALKQTITALKAHKGHSPELHLNPNVWCKEEYIDMLELNGKIVFITGGSGYVGRNLIRMLVKQGASVRALARSSKSERVVKELGAHPISGDMLDENGLSTGLEGAEYLIHAAANTSHSGYSAEQNRANIEGTSLIYRIAREKNVAKVLQISTEAVLLNGKPLVNADETTPMPTSWGGGYSQTKAKAEQIALAASDDVMSVVVIRPRFVWGRDDTSALPQLKSAAETGRLAWIGGGRYLTSTTHVDNLCHGALLALQKGRAGEVYFLSDGSPVVFREFISALLETQGIKPPQRSIPRFLIRLLLLLGGGLSRLTGGRINSPISLQEYATIGVEVTLNIAKAQSKLGYEPQISRDEGLADLRTYRDYLARLE